MSRYLYSQADLQRQYSLNQSNKYNFLNDKSFLQEIDHLQIKQQYIKITVLSWKQDPIEQVQGRVISGSLNINGTSSLRRTGSLTIFLQPNEQNDLIDIDNLFSINKKCILQLGVKNTVPQRVNQYIDDKKGLIITSLNYQQLYGDVVWFPLGVYVMFNPAISHSSNGITISMQIKDKMCLLNGDVAGQIHTATTFSEYDAEVDENGDTVRKQYTLIYDIIKQLVHHWGNQSLGRIVISEVPKKIKQVVSWLGKDTVYLYSETQNDQNLGWELLIEEQLNKKLEEEKENPHVHVIRPVKSGSQMGYIYTDFVYPGVLTCNSGDTVTSVLDKIIGVLGNYEYFYNIYGDFVFREKQNSVNMTYTASWVKDNAGKDEKEAYTNLPLNYYNADYSMSKSTYDFSSNECVISYNNTLNYNNFKNDFIVWGTVPTSLTGASTNILCRYHMAIDKKPEPKQHTGIGFYKDIYQTVRGVKLQKQADGTYDLPDFKKGLALIPDLDTTVTAQDWRQQIYYQMLDSEWLGTEQNTQLNNSYFAYYQELKEQFPKMFNLLTHKYKEEYLYEPLNVAYFLDFIDQQTSQLGKYSVNNIGRRSKIVDGNNQKINCVFQPYIPDIVFINIDGEEEQIRDLDLQLRTYGQAIGRVREEFYQLFYIKKPSYNSCYQKIKDLLYQNTVITNTVSISTLPIYYLQPNTRITINDVSGSIYGDYIIQSITLPLDISSNMNINCYKALQKI